MYLQNTAIVGMSPIGQGFAYKMQQHPEYGINLIGFVDSEPTELRADLKPLPVLGPPEQLPLLVRLFDIERVVFAYPQAPPQEMVELDPLDERLGRADRHRAALLRDRRSEGDCPLDRGHAADRAAPVQPLALVAAAQARDGRRAGGSGALVLLPAFLLIALLIKLDSRGPVFFRQVRMGAAERTFRIHKFRTMVADAEERKHALGHLNLYAATDVEPRMFKVPEDPRVTRVGRFLRRYSLDELPQLIDVLRGKMSLVGPRRSSSTRISTCSAGHADA